MERLSTNKTQVTLPGGRVVQYPWPVTIATILKEPELSFQHQETTTTTTKKKKDKNKRFEEVMGINVNGVVMSLSSTIPVHVAKINGVIQRNSSEGQSIFRRTLVFVVGLAAFKEFGANEFHVCVEHAIGSTSYMCEVDGGGRKVTEEELLRLGKRMKMLIDADLPIVEEYLSYTEAIEHFQATGRPYSKAAVETNNSEATRVTVCDGWAALYFRALCSKTGLLHDEFELKRTVDGFGFILEFSSTTESAFILNSPGVSPAPPSSTPTPTPTPTTPTPTPTPTSTNGGGSTTTISCCCSTSSEEKEEEEEDRMNVEKKQVAAIIKVYREYNEWGRLLCVGSVGELNRKVLHGESKSFVAISEALHNHKIVEIALKIHPKLSAGGAGLKMILIAGPSASGKTTFASKLGIQLRILGCVPVVLSVDNYFRPRVETPLDENGQYDFEALEALRVDYLNEQLLKLLSGEVVETPIFDFTTGLPKHETQKMQLPANGVLIMEGIHCLNPKLTSRVPDASKFRIFLAPLSQLNLDELNFTSHAVGRLVRRVVRDYNTRGFNARDTLGRWESVTRGEQKHIFPFLHTADVVFNTALDYETSVLKVFASPLLRSVTPEMPQYNLARNLLFILDTFFPIPHDCVPPDSLLREFIGGSFFDV